MEKLAIELIGISFFIQTSYLVKENSAQQRLKCQ